MTRFDEKSDDAPRSRTPFKDAVEGALTVLHRFVGSPATRDTPGLLAAVHGLERIRREMHAGVVMLGAGGAILTARTLELQGELKVEQAKVRALIPFQRAVHELVTLEASDDDNGDEIEAALAKMRGLVCDFDPGVVEAEARGEGEHHAETVSA